MNDLDDVREIVRKNNYNPRPGATFNGGEDGAVSAAIEYASRATLAKSLVINDAVAFLSDLLNADFLPPSWRKQAETTRAHLESEM